MGYRIIYSDEKTENHFSGWAILVVLMAVVLRVIWKSKYIIPEFKSVFFVLDEMTEQFSSNGSISKTLNTFLNETISNAKLF